MKKITFYLLATLAVFSKLMAGDPVDEVVEGESYLPEWSCFFPTLLADPRLIGYSAGYRTYDPVFRSALLPVSIGDRFSLYQFKNFTYGSLCIGIEACVWAVFEAKPKSLALINSDYYIGIPLTYKKDGFSARLRIFHESSHLGDELLVTKCIDRLNPSMEVIDFFAAYNLTTDLTIFAGVGRLIRDDESFRVKPYYIAYGFNYQMSEYKLNFSNLEASPYIGYYFSNGENNRWKFDTTIVIGYQWEKSYGHKFRIYLEGHNGYSHEGQFSNRRTSYAAIKILYGY